MVAYTTTYNFAKPTVGDDEDVWGGFLNGNFDTLESLLKGTTSLSALKVTGVLAVGNSSPKTWHSNSAGVIQFGGVGALENYNAADDVVTLSANVYRASDGTFKYMETNEATRFYQYAGDMAFQTASSGTANTAVTLNTRLFIKNDGNIGINTASPSSKLDVNGAITTSGQLTVNDDKIKVISGTETANVFYTGYGIDSARTSTYIRPQADNTQTLYIGSFDSALDWNTIQMKVGDDDNVTINDNTVWHAGNDDNLMKVGFGSDGYRSNYKHLVYGTSGVGYWAKVCDLNIDGSYHNHNIIIEVSSRYTYGKLVFTAHSDNDTTFDVLNAGWTNEAHPYLKAATNFQYVRSGSNCSIWMYTLGWQSIYYNVQDQNASSGVTGTFYDSSDETSSGTAKTTTDPGGTAFTDTTRQIASTSLGYVDVATGNYGTIKVDDDRGVSWAGYAIGDDWVFMGRADDCGIYNDTDNEWAFYTYRNAGVALYYNGVSKFETTSGGVAVTGAITATGDITAYYSDERLKNFEGKIDGALDKVSQLSGYYFRENDKAKELGFDNDALQVGVSAQEVEAVMPEVIKPAPVDPEYKTVQYEKLVPLLIEAIKELKDEVRQLKEEKA